MQDKIDLNCSLGEFVAKFPQSRPVFDKYSLDYCCGGQEKIESALKSNQIDENEFVESLNKIFEDADNQEKQEEKIWMDEPLDEIVMHIEDSHHKFLKENLPAIKKQLDTIYSVHREKHGDLLFELGRIFNELKDDLEKHLYDEETNLFPFIKKLSKTDVNEMLDKNDYKELIELLRADHDEAGASLRVIRDLTSNFELPDDVCVSFGLLYENLQKLEDDLHKHVHLENSILFPRIKDHLGI